MVIKSKIMTQEEVNDKFRKENHCEQYLVNGCSEFNEAEYQVSTVTTFSVDEKLNPVSVSVDLVCLEIFDNDSDEEVEVYEAGGVLQRFAQDFLAANQAA